MYQQNTGKNKWFNTEIKVSNLSLPSWVFKNVTKILSEKNLETENGNSNKDQENNLKSIKKEMVNLKKDIKAMRRDIQVVCEYMKIVKKWRIIICITLFTGFGFTNQAL